MVWPPVRASLCVAVLLLSAIPSVFGATLSFNSLNLNLFIRSNTILSSDIVAGNLTIASGLTITTNGFGIYVANRLVATGVTFITGNGPAGGLGGNNWAGAEGTGSASSFGGSGGAGGGWSQLWGGGRGGSTRAPGGIASIGPGGPGSVPANPVASNANITTWYDGGIQNFLAGAGGGGGGEASTHEGSGGAGAFGLYIQAQVAILSNSMIYADGVNGSAGWPSGGGGGGGGGCGRIIIAYQSLYLPASYNAIGGSFGRAGGWWGYNGGPGGGACNSIAYRYHSEPINISGPPSPPPGPGSPPLGSCYSVTGLSQGSEISVYLNGARFDIEANTISPGTALIAVNGVSYPIYLNVTQLLPGYGPYLYYMTLTDVSEAGSATLSICSVYIGQTTTTASTSTTSTVPSSLSSSSTTSSTSSVRSTTTISADPNAPTAAGSSLWPLLLLLLLIAIGLLVERERRKKLT